VLSECERGLELLFERVDAQRLEPPRLGGEPRSVCEPVQRRAAPELHRERGRLRRGTCIAGAQCNACLSEQLVESQGVDGRVRQRVAVGRGDDRLLPERSPKTSDVMLNGVARRGRQVVSPQRIDQRVDRDDATATKRKQCEEALALAATHLRRPSTDEDLEWPEKPDFQRIRHARGLHPPVSQAPVRQYRPATDRGEALRVAAAWQPRAECSALIPTSKETK
jgi:hypothetical protein